MYVLKKNVYIVQGFKNSCIYDLNNKKLYHINNELYDWINILLNNQDNMFCLDEDKKRILTQLLENGLMEEVSKDSEQNVSSVIDAKIKFAWIEVTTKCNLKCIHCYEESDMQCTEQMSMEEYTFVVSQLKDLGIKRVQIIGGEPFMMGSKLREMLVLAKANFESVEVFTNGTMIDYDWADFLGKNRIKVALSVYSYEQEEHDKVTGMTGTHTLTNSAIKHLKDCGVKYRVCNVLMKGVNIGAQNTDLYTLSSKRDVVRMAGRANIHLLSEELIRKKLIVEESFSYEINPDLFFRMRAEHNCFGSKIYIASNLEVYPCVMERRISHGSLKKDKLCNLLKEDILRLGKDCIEGCKDCEYRYACFDCRANSMSGNIFEKPWYCTYNPYDGTWEEPNKFIKKILEG